MITSNYLNSSTNYLRSVYFIVCKLYLKTKHIEHISSEVEKKTVVSIAIVAIHPRQDQKIPCMHFFSIATHIMGKEGIFFLLE